MRVIPFDYWSNSRDLGGFDISYADRLASDLNVSLDLIPFHWQELSDDLTRGRFDLAMAGVYITDDRLKTLTVSRSRFEAR